MTATDRASKTAEARINARLDYAPAHTPGSPRLATRPGACATAAGPAELQVIDAEATLRLVIFQERPHKFSEKPTYTIETASMDFNNIDPALFAPILHAVLSRF